MLALVVISNIEEKLKTVAAAVQAEGANAVASNSLTELTSILKEVPVNGILIDLVTSTRATAQEKLATHDLLQLYPHAKVKVTGNNVTVIGGNGSLQNFVQNCHSFKARVIRRCDRPVRYTGVLLSENSDFAEAEKAVTLNLTDGGCFVYSGSDWKVGDHVWLRFKENDCVVQGIVCWTQPWGNDKNMPGIGISFESRSIPTE